MFARVVGAHRAVDNIRPLIERFATRNPLLPSTRAYTHEWNGYNFLDHDPNYRRYVIIHNDDFVFEHYTTNQIESTWNRFVKYWGFNKGLKCSSLLEVFY
jgi:hypothetical protein